MGSSIILRVAGSRKPNYYLWITRIKSFVGDNEKQMLKEEKCREQKQEYECVSSGKHLSRCVSIQKGFESLGNSH